MFILNSLLLGVALAMDAFTVSCADGMACGGGVRRAVKVSSVFGMFQMIMPLAGWIFVTLLTDLFEQIRQFIPWISLLILGFLGAKMINDGLSEQDEEKAAAGFGGLILQGVATSIDALSAGLTFTDNPAYEVIIGSAVIGVVTFGICMAGVIFGEKIRSLVGNRGTVAGGVILILIGVEIFLKAVFDASVPLFLIR